jgi:hypothetical protein
VWRSLDGGRIFTAPVAAVQHRFVDHPSLAVGNRPNNVATVYFVWVASGNAGLGLARSMDAARHFAGVRTIGTPAGGVSVPAVAAGRHGAVYAAFLTGGYRHATAEVVASSDGGQRFSVARAVAGSVGYVGRDPG